MPEKTPNLRDWNPSASEAVDVRDTKMLDTNARETPETVTAENDNKELVTTHKPFGPLGATGRH